MHRPIAALREIGASDAAPAARHILHRDYETRGTISLKAAGTYKYSAHAGTSIICCTYALDDQPVALWLPGDPVPPEFVEAGRNPSWDLVAHGAHFEIAIERHILGPQHGFPVIPLERQICTQAMSLSLGLPARLDLIAKTLELGHRKDSAGERLMHMMSKPRKPHKDEAPGTYWFDHEARLQRLYSYCKQDTETEREIFNRLPVLPVSERALWVLSCKINDRGFHIDRSLIEAARKIARAAAPEINDEIVSLTGGIGISQIAKLLEWLQQQGYTAESLDRKAVEKQLLEKDLPPHVRRVLELRLGGAQAAIKKLDALLVRAGDDDRVRNNYRFNGASTGRFSGEGAQVQNLKRPIVEDIDAAIAAIATGDYAHVKSLYEKPLAVVGDCSRSMITAAENNKFIGGDFSSIEARTLAWIAGEEQALNSYRQFDATHDPADEPYRVIAAKIFNITPDAVTKEQRGAGKVCTLAFGFQGGVKAFRKFEPDRFTDDEVEEFKKAWRVAHPRIRQFWYDIDRAAWDAVRMRGRIVRCGRVAFKCAGAFLFLKLPSGRKLAFPFPYIKVEDVRRQSVVFADNAAGQFKDVRNGLGCYGGQWTENVVSAIARDILVEAMQRIEAASYRIVMHTHDEITCEVPIDFGSTEEFTQMMTRNPSWASDLPIAAEAWCGQRYCK